MTDRAALHAEVGIPACHERLQVAHAITLGRIVYKVNSFSGKAIDLPGKRAREESRGP